MHGKKWYPAKYPLSLPSKNKNRLCSKTCEINMALSFWVDNAYKEKNEK